MTRNTDEIDTGLTAPDDFDEQAAIDAIPGTATPTDFVGWADDSEYATVWGFGRVREDMILVDFVRCEAGLVEYDSPTKGYGVDPETDTREWAEEWVEEHAEQGIEKAEEYWEEDA